MPKDNAQKNEKHLNEARQFWDGAAAAFDNEPDHGLGSPVARNAWTGLLKTGLPSTCKAILDIGCGTGSLSVVLAGLGHLVTGIDLSPAMVALAEVKAAAGGLQIGFHVQDGAYPQFAARQFDGILCRHLLWALPDPDQVLRRWTDLLKPGGRLFLVEGFWKTGVGLHASDLVRLLPADLTGISVRNLSDQPDLWGGPVSDERYAIRANRRH